MGGSTNRPGFKYDRFIEDDEQRVLTEHLRDGAVTAAKIATGGLDFSAISFTDHPLDFSGITLPDNSNVIRGTSITPTRASGWVAFHGIVTDTPAAVYTYYGELHTAGAAEVLGLGSFTFADDGASVPSLFAGQFIAEMDAGAVLETAGGAPAIGAFALWAKVLLNNSTTNSGGVAAAMFLSFQANGGDVQAEDTSLINMEIASGGIRSVFKLGLSSVNGATYLFDFTDDVDEPVSLTNNGFLNDISATANEGWIRVRIGSTDRYIPLYALKA